ncbi:MAG: toxin-antitoxin system TumE family protein, partial [Anaerolineae bacterium]
LTFGNNVVLCVFEVLDFQQGVIVAYRYEVSLCRPPFIEKPLPDAETYCRAHYRDKDKLYWYDSWPHPNDKALAVTAPHHKHIHPDVKHHRIPAPGLSFTEPNLSFLIREVEQMLENQ